MSEVVNNEGAFSEPEKPVQIIEDVKFPRFPVPSDKDFDEGVGEEEKNFYKGFIPDLNKVVEHRLHCTACDRHLGSSVSNESKMKIHPMLRTLICQLCHTFYNSGEFDKGDDGSELYCRWCGQGGQVYCCSDCPHVFCAKCIKRNFGPSKIKEIENTDDWKCFKCNPNCLWNLRAICWALLRFCDLRNKIIFHTEDPELKRKYIEISATDLTECCKNKVRKREKDKKKEAENIAKKIVSKMQPTIQVKKFASINPDESSLEIKPFKTEPQKRAQKRSASPKAKPGILKTSIPIAPCGISTPPTIKRVKLPTVTGILTPAKLMPAKKPTYHRLPAFPRPPPAVKQYNGYNPGFFFKRVGFNTPPINDNINLSIESLTQGLDMASVPGINDNSDSLVCTPDFPLEPLCEVTEEADDDVQCITPSAVVAPKINNPPPLVARGSNLSTDNIVQMTENDVTVNAVTGGLKFRVDPQTLSSNKMYRLPDGRVFAINANPNMPGGYSATIVSVSDSSGKLAPKGETFAAKLSSISNSSTPKTQSKSPNTRNRSKTSKFNKTKPKQTRKCDMKVPVEWYRYNLIDAIDAMEYSLSRLEILKKEATTVHLRTRTVSEVKELHRTLEQLLSTSTKRFYEIRENLNGELKTYLSKKQKTMTEGDSSGEDDVLILPDTNDDPIFIDENSTDTLTATEETQEVDLTEVGSSEPNDSNEKNNADPLHISSQAANSTNNLDDTNGDNNDDSLINISNITGNYDQQDDKSITDKEVEKKGSEKPKDDIESENSKDADDVVKESDKNVDENKNGDDIPNSDDVNKNGDDKTNSDDENKNKDDETKSDCETKNAHVNPESDYKANDINGDCDTDNVVKKNNDDDKEKVNDGGSETPQKKTDLDSDEPIQDADMSEEMIEKLLKDNTEDSMDNVPNLNCLDIPDLEDAQMQ